MSTQYRFLLSSLLSGLLLTTGMPSSADGLADIVSTTLKSNPDVRRSAATRRAVDQQLRQSFGGYLPALDFSSGYGYESSNNPTTRGIGKGTRDLTRREVAVNARQLLFDGGAVNNDVQFQQGRVLAAANRVQESAESTALRAVVVVLEVLRRKELVALADYNVMRHLEILDKIRKRAKGGAGSSADVTQAEARVALARSSLVATQGNLLTARNNYIRVVGKPPEADFSRPDAPTGKLLKTLDELLQRSEDHHPTIQAAMADLAAAQASQRGSRSPFFPKFDLEIGTTNDHNLDGVRGTNRDVTALLKMRYNLYRGGADQARSKETAERVTAAQEALDSTSRQVKEAVRVRWDSLQTARNRLQYLKAHRDASQKVLAAYIGQFKIGQRTLLDVLDSENELFNAKSAYVTGQYEVLQGYYQVLGSTGDLLEALGVEAPVETRLSYQEGIEIPSL